MISLTRDKKGETGLVLLRIRDINFIELDNSIKRMMFHTRDEVFYAAGTLEYWIDVLNGSGYNFFVCDRNTAVNVDNIRYIDQLFTRARFEEEAGPKTKWCNMSKPKYKLLMDQLATTQNGWAYI